MASPPLDRRRFLRRGAQLGALALGAVVVGAVVEERERSTTVTTTTPTTTTIELGPPNATDWAALAASLSGTLVLPSNPAYASDRLLFNSKFVDLHPQGIAYCANAEDVARCLGFVSEHALAVAARSGGHSYAGYSNSPGLVLDVSTMSAVSVDTVTNTATVGAGAALIDVYNTIGSSNRLLPGGSCPTVGIAGLALGGGVGVFARRYGMTCDNTLSVTIVTADGRTVVADGGNHSDLLWACRGGGGGNFGVVTSFEFDVHPMPEVSLFTLRYPWGAAASMLAAWQDWIAGAPEELWANCQLLSQGTDGFSSQISGVYCGTPSALRSALAPLQRSIGTAPSASFIGSNPYIQAMAIEAGCSGLSIAACHLSSQNPDGTLSRSAYAAKSSYVNGPMNEARVTQVVDAVENLASRAPTLGGGLAFDAYGGAINRVASDATAFVHRDKLACIQATYSWGDGAPASVINDGAAWLAYLGADVFVASTGAYQNYIDPTLANWAEAYYGANLGRLSRVKSTYDPGNLFSFAQSIPPVTPG